MANPIIDLQDIDVTFKQGKEVVHAVKDVSLSIEKGDIYGIVGYSGAGKSTLVRTINLLQKPTDGTVTIDGDVFFKDHQQQLSNKELQKKRRSIGMIFQHFNLLNETSVIENVLFALKHSDLDDDAQEKKAYELLELVGLKDKAEFYPVQLSGGEQQRVSIARALANDPAILISDEATSALDPQNTNQILDLLKKLNTELDLTVVLITHEMDAVKRVANKISVMEHGQIIERGPLQKVFLQPQRELTRQFVGGSLAAIDTLKAFDLDQLTADEDLFQLVYNGNNVTKSIIIELYKKLGVEASMLYGNIEVLGGEPVGTLFVVVKGDEQQRQAAVQFLQDNKVTVTKIDDRRIWHE
ncbi:MAG: methionine ABC transporter ATP-binding protein [Limosilactobacillus oris]|jgi:D-methionine transport system ATP-binding protein|uniref:methionine ABC transporter ATP-binding protein n=1 Tax=Limosilactobacillus oris TaxID=1632 RepID=UPI000789F801|nr:methionine ABC transporter ATP-binding protein [Limosilactobacillus oris]AMS07466.1 methionine ABC transporter ATP-binding protein [Limosilactobacillus oris]MCH3910427.1 methionine ABC transporter ATP-binding protein [Limosilactobacillus oris]MCH3939553.1 methionine ABC transporter ATP-binding protein [Limosilactobacillus oris]MCI1981410.1 methionine ABC transporter ATP-binding protein [Limosilactobacillus oris]